ncbi:MAG: flagellar biosynthetic protein FliR [Pseudomonadota bacterium]
MPTTELFALLGQVLDFGAAEIYALIAVFTRVGAAIALLPGFGEMTLPTRVRLGAAIAFTLIVWPVVEPGTLPRAEEGTRDAFELLWIMGAEAIAGLLLGLAIRLMIMVLQLAGSIAAQSTSVAQIFGAGVTPDPMPAIGNFLTIAGIALAMTMDLHVKAAIALIGSYEVIPFGAFPLGPDVALWGAARAMAAFALAFSLAAPFVIAALLYNLALGAINRAMPQLMVALVGAPAITGLTLFFLWAAAPVILLHWAGRLDDVLAYPFGMP